MRAITDRPSWKARLARALGFDRNPMRRASDRAEAWIRAGLLILLLTGGPVAAVAAGLSTAHAGGTGPAHHGDFTVAAVVTALMTLAVTALAVLVVLRLVQGFLDWRRLTAWETALRRWQFA